MAEHDHGKQPQGFRHPHRGPGHFAEIEYADNISGTVRRIFRYFLRERGLVLALMLIVVLSAVSWIAAPAFQSSAIDIIAGKETGLSFGLALGAMLACYGLFCALQYFQGWMSARLGQRIVKRMREDFFGKLVRLPVKYLDTHSHGDVMSRMTNDIENVSHIVTMALPSIVSGALTIVGVIVMMVYYCWQLALLSMSTVLLTVLMTRLLSKIVRRFSRRRQALLGELNGMVEEMISGYPAVVSCNRQEMTSSAFCATSDSLTGASIRTEIFGGIMGPIMNCISNISFVIIAAFGGYFTFEGIISVGVISAFIVYARQFGRPINELAMIYGQLQTAVAGAERVFKVIDEMDEKLDGRELGEMPVPDVSFEHVSFSYEPGKPVIRDFSLHVGQGRKVALVGATGCGKTTIVNLLMRFYDVDSGRICIGGQDISDASRTSLRKRIAIVLQDTVLFSDTIRNNLKFGCEEADDATILSAATMSHCRSFIEHLPGGLDTVLTNAGGNLSQGQRQLLAIARAYVADPDILILDEATSNVDTRTEKAIQDAVRKVMNNRTSIVIAHRLSTIRDSDVIVVMDGGQIIESGTHEALLGSHGKYHELYMTQYASGMNT